MADDQNKSILVVDDDQTLREMYRIRMEAAGYTVVEATNGEEAMARAVENRPALILLDVMMPRVNGFDVLDILKSTPETKSIPVIVLTALMQDDAKKRVLAAGAAMCLVKAEITPGSVVESIIRVLEEKKVASEVKNT